MIHLLYIFYIKLACFLNNVLRSRILFQLLKIKISKKVHICSSNIYGDIAIGPSSKIKGAHIRGKFKCREGTKLFPGVMIKGIVSIGRYTSLNGPNLDIYTNNEAKVTIGSFCSIARNVSMQSFNHRLDQVSTYFMGQNLFSYDVKLDTTQKGDITIENDVWIGAHCVILSGAHIGTGAVIAANSVVAGYIPPYAVAAGSPAKVIKYRFSEEEIDLLLRSEWWKWSEEKLRKHSSVFMETFNFQKFKAII